MTKEKHDVEKANQRGIIKNGNFSRVLGALTVQYLDNNAGPLTVRAERRMASTYYWADDLQGVRQFAGSQPGVSTPPGANQ
ncbi:MAG: hypothetical protein ACI8PP_000641 [Candidatus Pseudothioglobus sp.]|jgi:hypothetical protein